MLKVTEKASEKIQEIMKGKEEPVCIRLFLSQGG